MLTKCTFLFIFGGILTSFLLSGCSERKNNDSEVQNDMSSAIVIEENSQIEETGFDITQVDGYDPSASQTVIEIEDAPVDMWANALGHDYIDARTFQRDRDIHITVEYELTDDLNEMIRLGMTDLTKTQVMIAPVHADNGSKFGETAEGMSTPYPDAKTLSAGAEWALSSEDIVSSSDSTIYPPVFVKANGFIKITDPALTSIEFTIPAAEVNKMIDKASSANGFDGISLTMGGAQKVTKITVDEGNIFLHSKLEAFEE